MLRIVPGAGWLLLPLVLTAVGCGKPNPNNRPQRPDQVLAFGALYSRHCSGCHGAEGKGGPAPPLNDPLYLGIVTDAELEAIIRDGRHALRAGRSMNLLMPAFGQKTSPPETVPVRPVSPSSGPLVVVKPAGRLTVQQIQALVAGIRAWGKPDPNLSAYAGLLQEATNGDATAGAEVYQRACWKCHGDQGTGTFTRSGDRKLSPAGPLHNAAFLELISDQALRRLVFTGRPDLVRTRPRDPARSVPDYRLSMPGYKGEDDAGPVLSAKEIADVVALLASWRKVDVAAR